MSFPSLPQVLQSGEVWKTYLELHTSEIDQLVAWVDKMRNHYYVTDGENIFTESDAVQIMLGSKISSSCDPIFPKGQASKQAEAHASVCTPNSAKQPTKHQLYNGRKKLAEYFPSCNLDVTHLPKEIHRGENTYYLY